MKCAYTNLNNLACDSTSKRVWGGGISRSERLGAHVEPIVIQIIAQRRLRLYCAKRRDTLLAIWSCSRLFQPIALSSCHSNSQAHAPARHTHEIGAKRTQRHDTEQKTIGLVVVDCRRTISSPSAHFCESLFFAFYSNTCLKRQLRL